MKKNQVKKDDGISEKEKQRILNNFYTKQIKNGKTTRAEIFDKISLILVVFILLVFFLYKIIGNFIISFILGFVGVFYISIIGKKILEKERVKKIEKIKEDFRLKLEEEKLIGPNEDLEDYIIKRYVEKKKEFKENINPYTKGKLVRLFALSIIFFIISYFTKYGPYYKIISVITFTMACFIGSYKITEYMRKKDRESLLPKDNGL